MESETGSVDTSLGRWPLFSLSFFLLLGGVYSLVLGQDIGPDLINYHLYSGELMLTGRGDYDAVPASLQTFHNPIYYGLYFFLFTNLPPALAGFLLGCAHGLIGHATFLLTASCLHSNTKTSLALSLGTGFLGFYSPFVIGTIGGSFSDLPQAILVLFGLLFVLKSGLFTQSISPNWMQQSFIGTFLLSSGALLKVSHFY